MCPTVEYLGYGVDGTDRYSDGSFRHVFSFWGLYDRQRGYVMVDFWYNRQGRLYGVILRRKSWLFVPFVSTELFWI